MNVFVVNKKSLHYRFNYLMKVKLGSSTDWLFENRLPTDFCSYWRMTFLHFLLASLLVAGFSIVLGMLIVTAIQNPVSFGITTGIILLIIGSFVGVVVGLHYLADVSRNRKEYKQKNNIPDGIVTTKYKSWKQKVCPMVEYK